VIHDGPYADTKEHLGGYFIIEVAHLDDALEWAARSPNASSGSTEVRPVLPHPSGKWLAICAHRTRQPNKLPEVHPGGLCSSSRGSGAT